MNALLHKLIEDDAYKSNFASHDEIIHQGLAPIYALTSTSKTILKANLLEQAKLQNWLFKSQQLFKELDTNHIKFIIFKGFAYTFSLYGNSHIRPYSDIDIFINKKNYNKTKQILNKLEYKQLKSRQGEFVSFQNSFFDNQSPQTVIDLHWQINNRVEFHKHFNFDTVYSTATSVVGEELKFKTLSKINSFILASFHYIAHRPEDRKHVWLYDLALMWLVMDDSDKGLCLSEAKQINQSKVISVILAKIKSTFPLVIKNYKAYTSVDFEETEDYLSVRKSKISDIKIRLKNIKGIKNKILFFSEYVFQSRQYVKNRYELKYLSSSLLYYPRMWLEDIIKLFK